MGGPNKAFGTAVLIVGTFIPQFNPELVQVMGWTAEIVQMSSAEDSLFANVLRDVMFRDWVSDENRRKLARVFECVVDWCFFHGLRWMDFSLA